ncbi:hypothetical protein [Nannocystis sp.]|uniref:hypothetical protein n=1 Tax=Nannocystis sp. TaxID=1962667 RepID=UPI0025DFAB09|nr:hypothetical protein [Nannocystis sp.]MBK7823625.1 hypothetical protein [Nannocystis sp.]
MLLALLLGVARPTAASPATDMDAASVTLAEAERRLADGDTDGAIARFEAALAQIPVDPGYAPARAEVLLTIVDAHEAGFARDGDLERLRRAKGLLDRYLGPLELLDEQGRAAAEERRVLVINAIITVEEKMRAEDAARAATARRERAARARRQSRAFTTSGAVLTGFGVAGVALMGAGLGLGRAADGGIAALKANKLAEGDDWSLPCLDDACRESRRGELDPLLARGNAGNALVIAGAVTGGTMLVTGAVLLALGRKKQREARQVELVPTASRTGFGLTLLGRF